MRELVFLGTDELTQSELRFIRDDGDDKIRLDTEFVCLSTHRALLSSVAFAGHLHDTSRPVHVLVLGLGAGVLPSYLIYNFSHVHVTCLELDPVVYDLAKEYFDLPFDSERLTVVIDDALKYVQSLADSKKQLFDIILCDIDGKENTHVVEAPPAPFRTPEFLDMLKSLLKASNKVATEKAKEKLLPSCLAINYVCEEPEKQEFQACMRDLLDRFDHVSALVLSPVHECNIITYGVVGEGSLTAALSDLRKWEALSDLPYSTGLSQLVELTAHDIQSSGRLIPHRSGSKRMRT